MPDDAIDGSRIRLLRELKGLFTQRELADLVHVPQSHISDLENGKLRNARVFVAVADKLDSTTDFLFRRGPFKAASTPEEVRNAASQMAFDRFAMRLEISDEDRVRCRRVLGHPSAPVSADGWKALAEMIERAIGPKPPTLIRRGA